MRAGNTAERLIRMMSGRRAGLALGILVIGVNTAYLVRVGGATVLFMTALLLVAAGVALVAHVRAWDGQAEEEPGPMDRLRNAALAFLLSASLYGIFV